MELDILQNCEFVVNIFNKYMGEKRRLIDGNDEMMSSPSQSYS